MSRLNIIIVGAIAIAESACAQTSDVAARAAYVPRGQAAQPSSWIGAGNEAPSALASHYEPRGQAAQPGSWSRAEDERVTIIASSGAPAGQAAQPGWREVEAPATSSAVAAGGATHAPAWSARAQ